MSLIEDEAHPLMQAAMKELAHRVQQAVGMRAVDQYSAKDIEQAIYDHRVRWKHKGVKFPEMVPLYFPRLRRVELNRADLDAPSVATVIVNLTVKMPDLTKDEIAWAISKAYPSYIKRLLN